ncbi:MAG: hypothetical protein IT342_07545 [Candidatus Melainabacteria bacterium]|nr:hypothetical protein [Candidatus Melainabacteria bacterium]
MKLLVRLLLSLFVIASVLYALPSFADSPTETPATKESSAAMPQSSIVGADSKESQDQDQATNQATRSLMEDLKNPEKKLDTLGIVAELLGVSSGLMLITGAILAACVKRFGLVKLMIAVGLVGGITAVAAPGIILMSGNTAVGVALTVFFLLMYIAVFFLPAILSFKDNVSKKWIITIINVAGCIVPGAGLVALYMVMKDKPAETAQTIAP